MCNAYKVKKMMKFLYGEINLNVTKFRKRFFNATFKKNWREASLVLQVHRTKQKMKKKIKT